jgi:uncharacterized membrane protein
VYFISLHIAATRPGNLWPALCDYTAGAVLITAIWWWSQRRTTPERRHAMSLRRRALWSWAVACGLLSGAGTLLYLVAVGSGDLALLAPIASLYPATTVLLALIREKERLSWHQSVGLVLAGAALLLASLG